MFLHNLQLVLQVTHLAKEVDALLKKRKYYSLASLFKLFSNFYPGLCIGQPLGIFKLGAETSFVLAQLGTSAFSLFLMVLEEEIFK